MAKWISAFFLCGYALNAWSHAMHYHPPVPYETVTVGEHEEAPLEIITEGHPTLRLIAEEFPVEKVQSPETQKFIDDMLATMKASRGVGLAAPQVNVSKRLFVMQSGYNNFITVINPEILYLTEFGKKQSREGCLSIPGKRFVVPRYKKLEIKYINRHGERIFEEVDGFDAIVIQHENDHLDGKLISDFGLSLDFFSSWEEFENIPTM